MRTVNRQKSIVCALAVSALLSQSSAITYAAEAEEFGFDQVVVTANRVPTKVSETAANVTVITSEEIAKGNYQNIGEILSHVPGVMIANNGNPGSVSTPFINGSEQVVVMIDGRRMNLPSGIGAFGMATTNLTSFIGVDNIERIEIIKTGRSALYGSDAVGGVINIITKQGEKNQTTLTTSGGSWNSSNYSLTNQGHEGNFRWYVTADKKSIGDYSDGHGTKYAYTGVDQDAYTIRLDQKINDGNLSFNYESFNNESQGRAAHKYDNTKQNNWDVTYKENTGENTDYQVKVYQNTNHRIGLGKNSWEKYDHDGNVTGVNYQINSKINAHNLLTAGIDWRKDEMVSTSYGEKNNTAKALYLQDIWTLTDKLSITPGMRYDKNDTYGNKTTPQIGVNYKENERTAYYASWGKVFQAPRFDELYWPSSVDPADSYYPGSPETHYDGNPNLKPVTGWNAEVGVNHKFSKTLGGKVSLFNRKLQDAISWKNNSTDPTKEYWTPSNVDQQEASGFEVQLQQQLSPELSTYVGYNYLNVKNKTQQDTDFVKDKNIADRTWNLGMAYGNEKVNVDVKGTAVMGRTNTSFKEKSYWLWDANLNVKLDKNYTTFLTVNNLFDTYYDRSAGKPCAGRNYVFGVKATF